MTTTLSAEDVRRLVMEPWCNECNAPIETLPDATHEHDNTRQALWARCPDCQPKGLHWLPPYRCHEYERLDGHWYIIGHPDDIVEVPTVIDLILMSIARDATAAKGQMTRCKAGTWGDRSSTYSHITTAIMSDEFEDAVKWRHRLKDLEEQT